MFARADVPDYSRAVDAAHVALVGAAALAGGVVNAIAGGGSLITFPVLVACGLPPVTASVTNTVAMCPGYFGAGMGVIALAALAVVLDDTLIRANALKQSVSLVVNVSAASVFVFSGRIDGTVTLVMAIGSLAGGALGGALASRVPAPLFRWTVVVIGVVAAAVYFARI